MTQTIYPWPPEFTPRSAAFLERGISAGGAPSLSGLVQVGQIDAGHWRANLNRIPIAGPAGIKAFRAFAKKLEGGGGLCRVPVFDDEQRPWPLSGGVKVVATASTGFTDGTRFTDGTGFLELTILITLNGAAVLNATAIDVTIGTAGEISGGEYFRLGERLHQIREVISVSGADQKWWIWPKLRQNYATGVSLNFDNPTCLMRMEDESSADLELEFGAWGFVDMKFVEGFTQGDIV